jgi:uroporphyrinogen decarboxylase
MNAKENYLEAIRFGRPEYVPLGNEPIWYGFQFEGNFRLENWTDLWGVRWEVGLADTVPFPRGHPLPSLDRLEDYRFPQPGELGFTEAMRAGLAAVNRDEQLVCGHLTYLLFERAWAIMGMENFLLALLTHPQEAKAFLHGIAHFARGVFDRYLELGVDAISFSEDLGSQRALMISPTLFREFLLPEYLYCFENVLRAGKIIHFHSCGCIDAIAGDLAAIGVTVLNPIQHRANSLARVKAETQGRMALHGGIDTAVLAHGTPADVRREVETVMAVLKPGGGYVCAPDQSIPGIPPENMAMLWQTAQALGRYE